MYFINFIYPPMFFSTRHQLVSISKPSDKKACQISYNRVARLKNVSITCTSNMIEESLIFGYPCFWEWWFDLWQFRNPQMNRVARFRHFSIMIQWLGATGIFDKNVIHWQVGIAIINNRMIHWLVDYGVITNQMIHWLVANCIEIV